MNVAGKLTAKFHYIPNKTTLLNHKLSELVIFTQLGKFQTLPYQTKE